MTIKEALTALISKLENIDNGAAEARFILENVTNLTYSEILFKGNDIISDEMFNTAVALTEKRLAGEPIQYVLGKWDFMDYTFEVGEGVLIPRPETEELVEYIVNNIKDVRNPVVYDLCSGSGCIGISIKKIKNDAKVYLVEKSDNALSYLKNNCSLLCGEMSDISVIKGDILCIEDFSELPKADVIVSNPPYIRSDEIPTLQPEVLKEPVMALDGGEDGLIFYRYLVSKWTEKLKENGFMAFECGEDQAVDIAELFSKIKFNSEIINDYNNIQRMVIGRRI